MPRERARAAPPLVGRLRLQPGARCTLETPAGLVGQMHGKYWTTLPPPCKNFASGSESGCTAKECLPLCRGERGGRERPWFSLSLCSNALLQSNFSFLPLITTTEEEEEEAHKCRGYFQKDALCGLICVVSSRGGRRYILDLLDLQRLVHVVRNCHLVTLNL